MNIRYEKTIPAELLLQETDLQKQQPQAHWLARLALAGMAVAILLIVACFIER